MSRRSDLLLANLLGNRWTATHAPAAGTTIAANSPAILPTQRAHIETLWYSIKNQMGAGALITTVTVSLRNASPAGTVLASVDHLVSISSTANVAITDMAFAGERGNKISITMDTVIASVVQTVNAFGWIEDTNG